MPVNIINLYEGAIYCMMATMWIYSCRDNWMQLVYFLLLWSAYIITTIIPSLEPFSIFFISPVLFILIILFEHDNWLDALYQTAIIIVFNMVITTFWCSVFVITGLSQPGTWLYELCVGFLQICTVLLLSNYVWERLIWLNNIKLMVVTIVFSIVSMFFTGLIIPLIQDKPFLITYSWTCFFYCTVVTIIGFAYEIFLKQEKQRIKMEKENQQFKKEEKIYHKANMKNHYLSSLISTYKNLQAKDSEKAEKFFFDCIEPELKDEHIDPVPEIESIKTSSLHSFINAHFTIAANMHIPFNLIIPQTIEKSDLIIKERDLIKILAIFLNNSLEASCELIENGTPKIDILICKSDKQFLVEIQNRFRLNMKSETGRGNGLFYAQKIASIYKDDFIIDIDAFPNGNTFYQTLKIERGD